MACLHDMVGRLMINAAGCRALLSLSGGALACAARDLAAHHMVGLPRGVDAGSRVGGGGRGGGTGSWCSHRCYCVRKNTPVSPPAGCQESWTRTSAGPRRGSPTTSPSQM